MVKRAQFSVKTPQINFIHTFKGVISLPHIITPAKDMIARERMKPRVPKVL